MKNVGKPKLYNGLIVFAAVILLLLFAAAPIQHALGITGLLLTELMLLICALAAVFIFRYDIRKVLPIKLPKLRQVLGVLLLWAGALLTGYLFIFITMVLFPKEMTDVSRAIGNYVTDAPVLISLVITALLPAICEETLCRGFIQYSFGGIKSKWLIIALVGVLFGIFHLSLLRFLPTMILGFALAYIMYETKNIVLPMIFHFTNNAVSLALSYAAPPTAASIDPALISKASFLYIGVILFFATAVPWLLIAGSRLLKPKEENAQKPLTRKTVLIAAFLSAFCFIAGIGSAGLGIGVLMKDMKVMDMSYTENVTAASAPDTFPVSIEKDGDYNITYVLTSDPAANGRTTFTLTGSDGQDYLNMTAKSLFGNTRKYLKAGDYKLTYLYDYDNLNPAPVKIQFTIMRLTY